jgi:hypothetical protein
MLKYEINFKMTSEFREYWIKMLENLHKGLSRTAESINSDIHYSLWSKADKELKQIETLLGRFKKAKDVNPT